MHRVGWPGDGDGLVRMAKDLEAANITSVLLPYGYRGIDFSVHLESILKSTKKIKMMIALPAYGIIPEFAAKTFKTVNNFTPGRLDLNLVSGKFDDERERLVIKSYPGDTSIIDSHDKRVALTESWMEKFVELMHEYNFKATLCVVGSSDTTIRIANNYADFLIVGEYMLNEHVLNKITDSKLILIIDPLVIKEGQTSDTVEYNDYQYTMRPDHTIRGTHDQVIGQIKKISEEFGIDDFMIVTDQKDLSGIFGIIAELTELKNN
jgi:alkanesulfonate monooxygenase SsuD/methylene tetrahydromethanopterin reductase-like flavin-dependent oxidoreductase (luciferase family)